MFALQTRELAARIIGAWPRYEAFPDSDALAIALGMAPAVFGRSDHAFAVLRSVLEAQTRPAPDAPFIPTLVAAPRQTKASARLPRPTSRMIQYFMSDSNLGGGRPPGNRLLIPVPDDSPAIVPLGGKYSTEVIATTRRQPGNVTVRWYDPHSVALGDVLFRVKRDGQVGLFQKVDKGRWVFVLFDGTQDIVDLPTVLSRMGHGSAFTDIMPVPGTLDLLHRP